MTATLLTYHPLAINHTGRFLLLKLPENKPLPPLSSEQILIGIGLLCLVTALTLCLLIAFLSKPKKKKLPPPTESRILTDKDKWKHRIAEVVNSYENGHYNQAQSMEQLAEIVRSFASQATGTDLTTLTLAELNQQPRTNDNREQLDLLRQTISALYPPEFANPKINKQAQEAQVSEAAHWVSTFVERWQQ